MNQDNTTNIDHAILKDPENIFNLPHSINNRLIVEPYKTDRALKAVEKSGFAMVSQKIAVKGLKLLLDAHLRSNENFVKILKKGSTIYIREELLHTQPWAQKTLESDAIEGPFMIVDLNNVEFVVPA